MKITELIKIIIFILFFISCCSCSARMPVGTDGSGAEIGGESESRENSETISAKAAYALGKDGKSLTVPDPVLRGRLVKSYGETGRVEIQTGIRIKVNKGNVVIAGRVKNMKQRAMVEKIARTTPGVKSVTANIRISHERRKYTFKGDRRSFGIIANDNLAKDAIRRRLAASPHVASSGIKIDVYNGVAVLSGFVRSSREKKIARELALFTDSVKGVVNNLVVDKIS